MKKFLCSMALILTFSSLIYCENARSEISVSFSYILYQTFELGTGQDRFIAYFEFLEDGEPLPSDSLEQIVLLDSGGNALPTTEVKFWQNAYYYGEWNAINEKVEYSGLYQYSGYVFYFPSYYSINKGKYTFQARADSGQTISYDIYYPGKTELSTVSKYSIDYQWNTDSSLSLDWSVPAGDFDSLMLWFMDGISYDDLLFVRLPKTVESITIPADVITDINAMTESNSYYLQLETRKYSDENVMYAKGVTPITVSLPSNTDGTSDYGSGNDDVFDDNGSSTGCFLGSLNE